MSQRKIKDAKDLETDELIYFKGHAKATYMSDGRNVEDAIPTKLSQIENDYNYVSAEDISKELDDVEYPYITREEMNSAIQQAITTTLNTEV
jgi:hypothetical protein